MSLHIVLIFVFVTTGLLMGLCQLAYLSSASDDYKVYPFRGRRRTWLELSKTILPNMALSAAIVIASAYAFHDWLFRPGEAGVAELAWEIVATLALYDLLYYCLHRFLFHEWKLLRSVHTLHHTVKHPTAFESLYVHPLENALGVSLLMTCTAIVGPVSMPAFAVIFWVYSVLNMVIHSGLDFRQPWLRPVAYIIRKHARHHASMRAGNYASVTPLPDIIFGTDE